VIEYIRNVVKIRQAKDNSLWDCGIIEFYMKNGEVRMAQGKYKVGHIRSSKPRHIKSNNQKLILSILRGTEFLTISEIAEKTSLSKTTVKKILENLLEMDLICSAGKGSSTDEGGKKPELFALNRTKKHIILVYINKIYLLNLCSEMEDVFLLDSSYKTYSYEEMITAVVDNIRILMHRNGITQADLIGIAIGVAGIIDSRNGIINHAVHHPTWAHNLNIRKDLADRLEFDVPIYLENSISFLGYAGLLEQENAAFDTLVTVYSGYHTGGCVLKKQELIHGDNGFMGEFGHMIADPHSHIRCICGASGCFEVMLSPERLLESAASEYMEYPGSPLSTAAKNKTLEICDIFSASSEGDAFACKLMDKVIFWFAILIRNIILSHDPQIIILYGIYQSAGSYFLNKLREQVESCNIFETRKDIRIVYSNTDNQKAHLAGAGYFVWNNFLNDHFLCE
jgi:predicted NBD/HSP70 family sugar kinase